MTALIISRLHISVSVSVLTSTIITGTFYKMKYLTHCSIEPKSTPTHVPVSPYVILFIISSSVWSSSESSFLHYSITGVFVDCVFCLWCTLSGEGVSQCLSGCPRLLCTGQVLLCCAGVQGSKSHR